MRHLLQRWTLEKLNKPDSFYKYMQEPTFVTLDDYRSDGAQVFSGEERGEVVASHIKKEYGENIRIEIPEDVYAITHTFLRGWHRVLPSVSLDLPTHLKQKEYGDLWEAIKHAREIADRDEFFRISEGLDLLLEIISRRARSE